MSSLVTHGWLNLFISARKVTSFFQLNACRSIGSLDSTKFTSLLSFYALAGEAGVTPFVGQNRKMNRKERP